jgi:hypothetical protein
MRIGGFPAKKRQSQDASASWLMRHRVAGNIGRIEFVFDRCRQPANESCMLKKILPGLVPFVPNL